MNSQPQSDRVLMGAGPSNPYPEVYQAIARPLIGLSDPELPRLVDHIVDQLRQVWRTTNSLTVPVSGTGSAAMEAALMNFIKPGDPVVIGINGGFGGRMLDMATRAGANVIRVDAAWGEPLDPGRLLEAHPAPAIIALVHAETTTGVRTDLQPLATRHERTLLVTDCVTSLGGIPVEIDEWRVDVAFSGTQKCLSVPPGLGPITVSTKAMERLNRTAASWYLDLNPAAQFARGENPRAYAHTYPISMLYALQAGLNVLLDEGLDASWQRHNDCGKALQDGLEDLGLKLFAAEGSRLPQLSTVWIPEDLPDGLTDEAIRSRLLHHYGIEIGKGVGELAGKIWRIGLMGHTARQRNVTLLLGALKEILRR